jgi:hypothetical protein
VFNGVLPRMDQTLLLGEDEADHWMPEGTKSFSGSGCRSTWGVTTVVVWWSLYTKDREYNLGPNVCVVCNCMAI